MRRLTLVVTGFFLGILFSALPASAEQIQNFRQVSAGFYAGANPFFIGSGDARDDLFPQLVNTGIKTIVDLQGTDVTEAPDSATRAYNDMEEPGEQDGMILKESQFAQAAGIDFQNLPINSNNVVTPEEEVRINQILDLLANASAQAPVYVHCQHGADRTGLIVALYRVLVEKSMTADQANDEWTRYGHDKKARAFQKNLDRYFCSRVSGQGPSVFCASLGF
jgi:protein tyrosine/serine phosphatase